MFDKANLSGLMKKAQEMQQKMQEAQAAAASLEETGESGAGLVRVTVNGNMEAVRVRLSDEVRDEENELIEDLICAAFNDAVAKMRGKTKQHYADTMGGAMPPGFQFPFS